MNLPLLHSRYLYLLDMAEHSEDEDERARLTAEAEAMLDDLGQAEPDKLDAYRHVYRRLLGDADACKAEALRLMAVRKSRERAAAGIKARAYAMLEAREARGEAPRIKTATGTYTLAHSAETVEGPADVAEWVAAGYFRVVEAPDKTAAKDGLRGVPENEMPTGFRWVRSRYVRGL